ncbi:UDP-N-acetyl-D-glucosamine 2-epimerase, UDP-hydrolysing [Paenibacillus sp. BIHB 4019]|uniref:UDP-N-acetyl-D-glucosamine 2-epimerase, UDP-hydrolysing n=1 Tax=Paenibacillus sp. BIHB 4019 TaxID=1870819 RepID=A0A1B2DGW5_9BACL|nr:UDP-N-acetylglucosamine 2-epimerase [Paenibacillus sp. BIHB 4019]ANY66974.1 UDP-N-acetyl-D-glucosamine 2-epimerase, UDP-hydrolysing [Paenibacillus sp. BIHB 4019]
MRNICVVTGSRADYGLLYPLLKEVKADNELVLKIAVTGMHLSQEYGFTFQEIEDDGFVIDEKVDMLLASDTQAGITKSMGMGLIGFADAYQRLKPDMVVVLGDRYEIMIAVQAAMMANIPIAHLHGGESTEGMVDEAIRHSISKMAHLHFASTEKYRQRIIQLGENPNRVFNVGAIGLDNIRNLDLLTKEEFEQSINFSLCAVTFLVTYHPLTLAHRSSEELTSELLAALDQFPQAGIIFTKPNSDADGRIISKMIDDYVKLNEKRCVSFDSLGKLRYLSALQHVDVVIGNSSSGIIEVPMFKKPTVDIGIRQQGRIKGTTVIQTGETREHIIQAIHQAMDRTFLQSFVEGSSSLYGNGGTAAKIKEQLKQIDLTGILNKRFYDIEGSKD